MTDQPDTKPVRCSCGKRLRVSARAVKVKCPGCQKIMDFGIKPTDATECPTCHRSMRGHKVCPRCHPDPEKRAAARVLDIPEVAVPVAPGADWEGWEIQVAKDKIQRYSELAPIRDLLVAGTIGPDHYARKLAPAPDRQVQVKAWERAKEWRTIREGLAREEFEIRNLYEPVWAHGLKGAFWGAVILTSLNALGGIVGIGLDVAWPMAGSLLAAILLLLVASYTESKAASVLATVIMVVMGVVYKKNGGCVMFGFMMGQLFFAFVVAWPVGFVVGSLVGLCRLSFLPQAPIDEQWKSNANLRTGLAVPGIACWAVAGLVAYIFGNMMLAEKREEWISGISKKAPTDEVRNPWVDKVNDAFNMQPVIPGPPMGRFGGPDPDPRFMGEERYVPPAPRTDKIVVQVDNGSEQELTVSLDGTPRGSVGRFGTAVLELDKGKHEIVVSAGGQAVDTFTEEFDHGSVYTLNPLGRQAYLRGEELVEAQRIVKSHTGLALKERDYGAITRIVPEKPSPAEAAAIIEAPPRLYQAQPADLERAAAAMIAGGLEDRLIARFPKLPEQQQRAFLPALAAASPAGRLKLIETVKDKYALQQWIALETFTLDDTLAKALDEKLKTDHGWIQKLQAGAASLDAAWIVPKLLELAAGNVIADDKAIAAIRDAGAAHTAQGVSILTAWASGTDAARRKLGLDGLAVLGVDASAMVPQLMKSLKESKDLRQRQSIAASIANYAVEPTAANLPLLVDALQSSQPVLTAWAMKALAGARPKQVPEVKTAVVPLAELLQAGTADSKQVIELLGSWGPVSTDAIPVLVSQWIAKWARDDEIESALKRIEPGAPKKTIAALAALLESANTTSRGHILTALAKYGADAAEALPALEKLVDGSRAEATAAITCLGAIGAPAVPALRKALKNKEESVQREALEALQKMGEDAKAAAKDIVEILRKNPRSYQARDALKGIGTAAIPAVKELLKDKDKELREQGCQILGAFGKEGVPALVDALGDKEPQVKREAIDQLGRIGAEARAALPALKKLAKEKDETVFKFAAENAIRLIEGK